MEINELIQDGNLYLAHKSKYKTETIEEHSKIVLEQFYIMDSANGIMEKVREILRDLYYDGLSTESINVAEYMFINAMYLHDIGKVNRRFQVERIKSSVTDIGNNVKFESKHSIFSSVIYLDLMLDYLDNSSVSGEELEILRNIAFYFSYVISRHHSHLEDFLEEDLYIEKLTEAQDKMRSMSDTINGYVYLKRCNNRDLQTDFRDIENFRNDDDNNRLLMWLLVKMLFSSLVTADFMAARVFFSGKQPVIKTLVEEDVRDMVMEYESNGIVRGIREYSKNKVEFSDPINTLRSEMFLDAEKELTDNIEKRLFYLEAPTGSGKTITSINLALRMMTLDTTMNKIQYIFPFNALVEQTSGVLEGIFGKRFNVVNSLTEIGSGTASSEDDRVLDYGEVLLQRQNMQYTGVITSHVNLFNRIFGVSRNSNLSFTNLCNSVVIIDEIQSYRNEIWLEIVKFLHVVSKYMNVRFLVMSATLPNLSKMINRDREVCELITNREKYFSNPLFRDRVKLDFSLLSNTYSRNSMEKFAEDFLKIFSKNGEDKKYLIEFISKKSAREFFNVIQGLVGDRIPVIELTGDDSMYVRNEMIKRIKSEGFYGIVVATQVIEAGVDIDMDVGLKDISLLDSEEQFLGRINRSCKRDGIAYFFNMDYAKGIYREDMRVNLSIANQSYRKMLETKDFRKFYESVKTMLETNTGKKSMRSAESVRNYLRRGDYQTFYKHMRLINSETVTVFIDYDLVKDDGDIIRGCDVWEKYKELEEDKQMDYGERRVRISRLKEEFSYFTYNLFIDESKIYFDFSEEYNGIYYVHGGEHYMDEYEGVKKFSQLKFLGSGDGEYGGFTTI